MVTLKDVLKLIIMKSIERAVVIIQIFKWKPCWYVLGYRRMASVIWIFFPFLMFYYSFYGALSKKRKIVIAIQILLKQERGDISMKTAQKLTIKLNLGIFILTTCNQLYPNQKSHYFDQFLTFIVHYWYENTWF